MLTELVPNDNQRIMVYDNQQPLRMTQISSGLKLQFSSVDYAPFFAAKSGPEGNLTCDFSKMMENKNAAVKKLTGGPMP